jgi:hypothetical protein
VALPPPVEETDSGDVGNAREELMYIMVRVTEELGDVGAADEYVGDSV